MADKRGEASITVSVEGRKHVHIKPVLSYVVSFLAKILSAEIVGC
jgi:hypothetical protein